MMLLKVKKFFLDNIGLKQTIIKNTIWLSVGETITRFLNLILVIWAARALGPTEYGKFTFALAFVSLFLIFSDFGISTIVTREFSQEREKEKEFSSIFSLRTILSIGALLIILLGSFFITQDQIIRQIIWILAVFIIIDGFPEILYAFLRARQKMEYESWAKIFQTFLITLVGIFVIANFASVKNLSYAYLFSSLLGLILILIFFSIKIYRLNFKWNRLVWQKFLSMSWPLALAGIFSTIYSQIDLVMMGHWGQIIQSGWYGAAYRIVGAVLIPAVLINQSFFPALSAAFKDSKEKAQKIYNYFMEAMIVLAIPLAVGGIFLASKIIDWIYNPDFLPAVLSFQVLLGMAAVSYFFYPLSAILIIVNWQKKIFWITFLGAALNVILNLILIPRYSLNGAALATLMSMVLMLAMLFVFNARIKTIKFLNRQVISTLAGAVLSVLIMCGAIFWLANHCRVIFSVLLGAGVYLASFLVYKGLLERNLMKL